MPIVEKTIEKFNPGTIDTVDAEHVPDGAASSSLDWQNLGDRIELRRGSAPVGTESTAAGSCTGLFTAYKANGGAVVFRKCGQKLQYLDVGAGATDWAETGTSIFPAAAVNDDASFAQYNPSAGNQLWVSSPNSGLYKVMLANPGSYQDMSDAVANFGGTFRMKISLGRMFAWGRPQDKTGFYGSYVDQQSYGTASNEQDGTGDGTTKSFSFTLGNRAPRRTFFAVQVSAASGTLTSITGITNATNAKITAPGHGLTSGQQVIIQGIAGGTGTGTVSASAYTYTFTGSGTHFTTQLAVGCQITVGSSVYTVASIASDTSLTVWQVITAAVTGSAFTYTNMTNMNGQLATVTLVIDSANFTVSIDSTGYGVYTSGGTVGKVESFSDDYSGNLTSPAGGTGTVNYTTGAVSLTFALAPGTGALVLSTYQYEDAATHGIADFTHSTPRTAGQGFVFRQDDSGLEAQNSYTYNSIEYAFHRLRTWAVDIQTDDTQATNLPYRARIGISNWRGGVATGTGVYFINDIDQQNVKLQKIALNQFSTDTVPSDLSKVVQQDGTVLGMELDGYRFDRGCMEEYGDTIAIGCRTAASAVNNRLILYDKLTGTMSAHSLSPSCLAVVGSDLWMGDAASPNVYKIFSGYDDDNSTIASNFWVGKSHAVAKLYVAKVRRLILRGLISAGQSLSVYASADGGPFGLVGTVSGTGSYVNRSSAQNVPVGMSPVGTVEVGQPEPTVPVYPYEHALKLALGKLVHLQLRFVATGTGYVSVSRQRLYDIQAKSLRPLNQ